MVSKRIDLGPGLIFGSISAAKVHFDPVRAKGSLDVDISMGHFSEMKILYEKYCIKTNYPMPSPVAAFYPTMKKETAEIRDAWESDSRTAPQPHSHSTKL
jgi:hypothetical protein